MTKREPKDNKDSKENSDNKEHKESAHKEHKSRTKKEHEHLDLVSDPFVESDAASAKPNSDTAGSDTEFALLKQELDEAKDRTLRARAELENYRARVNRQMDDERKYASIDLMRDLLPIWDNINRAIDAAEKTKNEGHVGVDAFETLVQGVRLVQEQFSSVLNKHHCEKIEAMHKPFDPNFHESIAKFPDPTHEPNTVINEALPGFKLHDRIVRPSQVVLSAS